MESRALKFIVLSGILLQLFVGSIALRTYNFQLLSAETASSDESKMNVSSKVVRVGRHEYSISGMLDLKFDTDESTMAGVTFYSSNSGNDYAELPYKIPTVSFNEFIDTHYDEFVYKNFKSCSNIPKISGKLTGPFPRNKYIFNRCIPDGFGIPDYLPPAYYKIYAQLSGEVDAYYILIIRVTSKLLSSN